MEYSTKALIKFHIDSFIHDYYDYDDDDDDDDYYYYMYNHNYNKILKSDWFSTALISALIGQFNRTVRVMPK